MCRYVYYMCLCYVVVNYFDISSMHFGDNPCVCACVCSCVCSSAHGSGCVVDGRSATAAI